MERNPAVVGPSIGRLYREGVPPRQVAIRDARPTCEIYHNATMEHCAPIL